MPYPPSINNGITARRFVAVTPANTDLPQGECRALYIGTGGDLVALDDYGNTTTFKNVPSGTTLSIQTARVTAATTAADIVAYY